MTKLPNDRHERAIRVETGSGQFNVRRISKDHAYVTALTVPVEHIMVDAPTGATCEEIIATANRFTNGWKTGHAPALRSRPKVMFTISQRARERLEELASRKGTSMSQVVEDLILSKRLS